MSKKLDNFISKEEILNRAKENWNGKTIQDKILKSRRYKHIFLENKMPLISWLKDFDELNQFQQNLLIKGEIIRTYNSLPNTYKAKLVLRWNLSKFSSKWHNLPYEDKINILKWYGLYS